MCIQALRAARMPLRPAVAGPAVGRRFWLDLHRNPEPLVVRLVGDARELCPH